MFATRSENLTIVNPGPPSDRSSHLVSPTLRHRPLPPDPSPTPTSKCLSPSTTRGIKDRDELCTPRSTSTQGETPRGTVHVINSRSNSKLTKAPIREYSIRSGNQSKPKSEPKPRGKAMPRRPLPPSPVVNREFESLPMGWAKWHDQNGVYYLNVITNQRVRDKPTCAATGDLIKEREERDENEDRMESVDNDRGEFVFPKSSKMDHQNTSQFLSWPQLKELVISKRAQKSDYQRIFEVFVDEMHFQQTSDGRYLCDSSDVQVVLQAINRVSTKAAKVSGLEQRNHCIPASNHLNAVDVDHGLVQEQSGNAQTQKFERLQLQFDEEKEDDNDINPEHRRSHSITSSLCSRSPLVIGGRNDANELDDDDCDDLFNRMMSRLEGQERPDQLDHEDEDCQDSKWTYSRMEITEESNVPNLPNPNQQNINLYPITMPLDIHQIPPISIMTMRRTRSLSLNDIEGDLDLNSNCDGMDNDDSDSDDDVIRDDLKLTRDPGSCASVPTKEHSDEQIEEMMMRNHHRSRTVDGFEYAGRGRRRAVARSYVPPLTPRKSLINSNGINASLFPKSSSEENLQKQRQIAKSQNVQSLRINILLKSEKNSLRKRDARLKRQKKQSRQRLNRPESPKSTEVFRSRMSALYRNFKGRCKTPNSR